MCTEQLKDLISRLRNLYEEASSIESQLSKFGMQATQNRDPFPLLQELKDRIRQLELQNDEKISACSRINFKDDHYTFINAIDGDTIVVAPPRELRYCMNDIHVRLYGIETPERNEPGGKEYQGHLENLCAIDAKRTLQIVWERERVGTAYEGFPKSSFERCVGHVFFNGPHGRYYYVNGLMHLLEGSSLFRKQKNLLFGSKMVEKLDLNTNDGARRLTYYSLDHLPHSTTFDRMMSLFPPECLLLYRRIPSLDLRDYNAPELILDALKESWAGDCPFQLSLLRNCNKMLKHVSKRKSSAFDLPLAILSKWANNSFQELSASKFTGPIVFENGTFELNEK